MKLKEDNAKKLTDHLDHPYAHYNLLLGATVILLTFGIVMVASASSVVSYQNSGNSWALVQRQILFAVLGVALMYQISRTPIMTVRRLTPLFAGGVMILLVLVLLIGTARHGQKNWIELPAGMRIQPSEFAKLAIVLFGADMLERKSHLLRYTRELMFPVGVAFLIALVLVVLEGDVGTAIVMVPIMLASFYLVGVPMKLFGAIFGAGLAAIAVLTAIAPYRIARFTSFLNPEADPQGTGFQLIHGMQALGSGGLTGVGLGGSKEKWGTLPASETDFIFAVIGEETGIIGTVTVLLLFAVIIFVGLRIARHTDDLFIQIASFSIITWMFWQMVVNVGAVIRLMPITGVPLPLISYGGSSLLPSLAALGLLMAFAKHEADK